jgi:hypothetical protein
MRGSGLNKDLFVLIYHEHPPIEHPVGADWEPIMVVNGSQRL